MKRRQERNDINYGYAEGVLTNEMAITKCIFHVSGGNSSRGMHTHIKGFTFDTKNTRYGIHKESGTYGRGCEWEISDCIFLYGGRPDIVDSSIQPVFGMGMSPFEYGKIKRCLINYTEGSGANANTIALKCHDNVDGKTYNTTPSIVAGAVLDIEDCNFNGYSIEFTTVYNVCDTDFIANIKNCKSINKAQYRKDTEGNNIWYATVTNSDITENQLNEEVV